MRNTSPVIAHAQQPHNSRPPSNAPPHLPSLASAHTACARSLPLASPALATWIGFGLDLGGRYLCHPISCSTDADMYNTPPRTQAALHTTAHRSTPQHTTRTSAAVAALASFPSAAPDAAAPHSSLASCGAVNSDALDATRSETALGFESRLGV
jgi:hypothetical protein